MAELAQVIVDVPTMQTDQPYTYAIPKRLESQIQVGMRVIVPFGRGKREVQGFVVGIDQPTEYDGTLKSIIGLMDLVPVVNTELLDGRSNLCILDLVLVYDAAQCLKSQKSSSGAHSR